MKREDLFINGRDRIDLSVYFPDTVKGRYPVVINSTGYGGTKEIGGSTKKVCEALIKNNVIFVSFSPYTFGETKGIDSQFSYGRWSENIEDVYNWIIKQKWALKSKIGCFAISSGTTTAIRYAQRSKDLKFIISIATCLSLHVGMNDSPILKYLENVLIKKEKKIPEYFGKKVSDIFYKDSILNNPMFKINEIKCPVYFLQGKEDNVWRRSDAWTGYLKMLKNKQKVKYKEITKGDHGLDTTPDICARETINWLKEIGIIRV